MEDNTSSCTNNAGSRSWTTRGNTQPGGAAAGSHPDAAAAGSHAGGAAAGSHPDAAAAGSHAGGAAAGSHPDAAAAGSHAGGAAAGSHAGGAAAGSHPGGAAAGSHPGGAAAGSHPGGAAAGSHPGGAAAGSHPGGAAAGSHPSAAAAGSHPGGAAAGSHPGGATGCQDGHPHHLTEEAQDQYYKPIHPRNNSFVFYIKTVGCLFTMTVMKEWMGSRFPGDCTKKGLILRKENCGKIQQSFSEVHRVRKLLELGKSVCKVVVEYAKDVLILCEGTGFVLFDNFILTNAHLFKGCVEGQQLKEGVKVFVLFNYEDPDLHTNYHRFQLALHYIYHSQGELDYAILELNPEGHKPNDKTQKKFSVPPGLLNKFSPMPLNGQTCIIGHPARGVKKIDFPFIIEKEKREQAVNDHLHQYKDNILIFRSICQLLKQQRIENIFVGGNIAEKVLTYKTFMYDGSSGSPVFDAYDQVVGLHTGGYGYECTQCGSVVSVIEHAQSLLTIFEHFVRTLKERGNQELLMRIKEEAKGNRNLEKVILSVESRKRKASSSEESGPKAKKLRTE